MATGKSSAKSGGKKRSACFFVNDGFPAKAIGKVNSGMMINQIKDDKIIQMIYSYNKKYLSMFKYPHFSMLLPLFVKIITAATSLTYH